MNGKLKRRLEALAEKFYEYPENQAARRPWTQREIYQALKDGYKRVRRGEDVAVLNPFKDLAIRHKTRTPAQIRRDRNKP